MAASSSSAVPEWGARLVRRLHSQGYSHGQISVIIEKSTQTVSRLLKYHRKHGVDRKPRQGQNKRSDPRWVFAGATKQEALALLEEVKQSGDDADELQEVYYAFLNAGYLLPAYPTLCRATLRSGLELSPGAYASPASFAATARVLRVSVRRCLQLPTARSAGWAVGPIGAVLHLNTVSAE